MDFNTYAPFKEVSPFIFGKIEKQPESFLLIEVKSQI